MGRVSWPTQSARSSSQVNLLMMLVPAFFILQGAVFFASSQMMPGMGCCPCKVGGSKNVNMNGVKMKIGRSKGPIGGLLPPVPEPVDPIGVDPIPDPVPSDAGSTGGGIGSGTPVEQRPPTTVPEPVDPVTIPDPVRTPAHLSGWGERGHGGNRWSRPAPRQRSSYGGYRGGYRGYYPYG